MIRVQQQQQEEAATISTATLTSRSFDIPRKVLIGRQKYILLFHIAVFSASLSSK